MAHYLADLQRSDTRSSLRWNRLSVREADQIADPMAVDRDLGVRGAALYPSLWLNVADDHRLLGEFDAAYSALRAAREALTRLGPAGRPPGVGDALDDLARRLAEDRKAQPPDDHTESLH